MIENDDQLKVTTQRRTTFQDALDELRHQEMDPLLKKLQMAAIESQLEEFEKEISDYAVKQNAAAFDEVFSMAEKKGYHLYFLNAFDEVKNSEGYTQQERIAELALINKWVKDVSGYWTWVTPANKDGHWAVEVMHDFTFLREMLQQGYENEHLAMLAGLKKAIELVPVEDASN